MPVVQLDRTSDSDSEGRAFDSHRAYQITLKQLRSIAELFFIYLISFQHSYIQLVQVQFRLVQDF